MTADYPSFPEPPGQAKVRVLRGVEGLTLTNEPDPDRLAEELNLDNPLGRALLGPLRVMRAGCASVPTLFKGFGWLVLGLGSVIGTIILISTIVSDGPIAGRLGLIGFRVGFVVVWVAFASLWLVLVGKIFPPPDLFWRLDLGPDSWVLRRGNSRSVLGRWSPSEIERLTIDRQGRVIAETLGGQRRRITGPMTPFEAAWAKQALAGLLGKAAMGIGVGDVEPVKVYAGVPTVDPESPPGSRLRHRLSRSEHPWRMTLGCLAIAAFWNLVTGIFVVVQLSGGDHVEKPGWLFLSPFILIGLVAIAGAAASLTGAIVDSRAGSTVVEVSANPLTPGERCRVFVSQPVQPELMSVRVRLACQEEVRYPAGDSTATDSKRVRELEVYHGDGLPSVAGLPFETTFEFEVPADAMHSLEVDNNKITWLLEVEGGPADRPAFQRRFAIVVNPPVGPEPSHD